MCRHDSRAGGQCEGQMQRIGGAQRDVVDGEQQTLRLPVHWWVQ